MKAWRILLAKAIDDSSLFPSFFRLSRATWLEIVNAAGMGREFALGPPLLEAPSLRSAGGGPVGLTSGLHRTNPVMQNSHLAS